MLLSHRAPVVGISGHLDEQNLQTRCEVGLRTPSSGSMLEGYSYLKLRDKDFALSGHLSELSPQPD